MAAVKEWMMRLQEAEEESLNVVMNEASESFFPDPAYV